MPLILARSSRVASFPPKLFECANIFRNGHTQVFNDDITGSDGDAIEIYTAFNGSFDDLSGNFTLKYGIENTTLHLPFNATAGEVEDALEVKRMPCSSLDVYVFRWLRGGSSSGLNLGYRMVLRPNVAVSGEIYKYFDWSPGKSSIFSRQTVQAFTKTAGFHRVYLMNSR